MKEYFNIKGINYLFKDKGAIFFDEFGGVTMIYDKSIINNILKTKRKTIILDSSVFRGNVGDSEEFIAYCCGSRDDEPNELACAYFERGDLTGEILVMQRLRESR